MNSVIENTPATQENVWAAFRETDRLFKEADARWEAKFEKEKAEWEAEWRTKFDESKAEFDRRAKKLDEQIGGISNNNGFIAEEYFFNSIKKKKQNFFGENFDRIEKNVKPPVAKIKDEYDIVLVNGQSVAIVEVKYKAHQNDVPSILRKAETFRINFPNYASHKIYIGLATMAFYSDLEKECIEQGIAVIKQVGENVIINDANLKIF
jgi:hypothetical protein